MIWQTTTATLRSNEQQRTDKAGDTKTGCQKPDQRQKTSDDDDRLFIPSSHPYTTALVINFMHTKSIRETSDMIESRISH